MSNKLKEIFKNISFFDYIKYLANEAKEAICPNPKVSDDLLFATELLYANALFPSPNEEFIVLKAKLLY